MSGLRRVSTPEQGASTKILSKELDRKTYAPFWHPLVFALVLPPKRSASS